MKRQEARFGFEQSFRQLLQEKAGYQPVQIALVRVNNIRLRQ
jgi:hypothetical protein